LQRLRAFDALKSAVDVVSYTYDGANQLASETQQIMPDTAPMSIIYGCDLDGNRTSTFYPSGGHVTYAYSARNQITDISNNSLPVADYIYDPNGNRETKTLANNTATAYGYRDDNRISSINHQQSTTVLDNLGYDYDDVGTRKSRTESATDFPAIVDAYDYDPIDQIDHVKYNFHSNTNTQDRLVDYNYDNVGNRTSVIDNTVPTNCTPNNLNQYTAVGSDTPGYDGNANLTEANGWTYTYDAQNRLIDATGPHGTIEIVFSYDARNRCVTRNLITSSPNHGGTVWTAINLYYDGWNLIEEQDSYNGLQASYVHGAQTDEMLTRDDGLNIVYYHQDALGSTVALSDSSGNVVERYKYDVYGAPTIFNPSLVTRPASLFSNRFLFTGREYLPEAKLYDYRNRIYSPELGRFVQTDPERFQANDINLYRYVNNQPTLLSDPDGLYQGLVWNCTITAPVVAKDESSKCSDCHDQTGEGEAASKEVAAEAALDDLKEKLQSLPAGCRVNGFQPGVCVQIEGTFT
jgi:RHS repeat-associated protein